jgi:hypothetical protein
MIPFGGSVQYDKKIYRYLSVIESSSEFRVESVWKSVCVGVVECGSILKKIAKHRQVSCMTTWCVGFYTEVMCNICIVTCIFSWVPQRNVVNFLVLFAQLKQV